MADRISRRALNRALLGRQLLLERTDLPVLPALDRLVGLQGQEPPHPYIGLHARLAGFRPDDLGALLTDRKAVRATLMRATIHLVSADDYLGLRPFVQPALERDVYPNVTYGRERLEGLDMPAVLAFGRSLLADGPRTNRELRRLLGLRWPDRDPAALAYAVGRLVAAVQTPPRGVWGQSGQPRLSGVSSWLGTEVAGIAPETIVPTFSTTFTPA